MNYITKPRLDIKRIQGNVLGFAESINQRFPAARETGLVRVQSLLDCFTRRQELQLRINHFNRLRNTHQLDDAGRVELAQCKLEHDSSEQELHSLAIKLPNFTHPDVPIGGMSNAKTVRESPVPSAFKVATFQTHLQLGQALGLLDFSSAAKTSGSKFVFMRNQLAMMQTALELLSMQFYSKRGFEPIATPELIKPWILESCGFAPRSDEEDQVYHIQGQDLCLIGTSEIALAGYFSSTTQTSIKRMLGISHCYRTEAGSGGKHSKGLYRLHQFSKTEMFVVCSSSESEQIHGEMINFTCEFLDLLGLQYRVMDMPTEELGASAYRKYDVEVYMPGSKRWGEVASLTNCIDYQSRRLEIKYKSEFAHTLNGTACALPRILLAIMETYQLPDGQGFSLPECLQPLCGFKQVTKT
ncbi:serine-tRNA ligase [Batrachochytrium salamandrivorans]|nr:serine-tRNA ligase [Batrachochytrium salamandrivorans]